MPIYTLKNTKTGEESDFTISYDEMNAMEQSGDYVMVPKAIGMKYNNSGKPDNTFRDILKEMKKNLRLKNSSINTF